MLRVLVAAAVFLNSFIPSYAYDAGDGLYYFRYKSGISRVQIPPVDDDWASKTVTASFVGGIGVEFHETLPLKPEWEDDAWRVDSGSLPQGISFNPTTRAFEGVPAEVTNAVEATLYGYDSNGNRVARANVTFDVVNLPANSVKVDLYAHTKKFYNSTLGLPTGVVIDRWEEIKTPPEGIKYNGRYVEGTPSKVSQSSVLNIGYDFNNNPIFAFYGTFTVTDGPEFPVIADDLKEIGWFTQAALWEAKRVTKIKRAVKDASKVRYSVELRQGSELPGTLTTNSDDFQRYISGSVTNFYDQATIRYKALDTDGAVGYSNWFKIGSLGPEGICTPSHGSEDISLQGVVGESFLKSGFRIPTGRDSGVKNFKVVSGDLPEGLSLNADTGVISGTPVKEEVQHAVLVDIAFPGNQDAKTVHCGPYMLRIAPASIKLIAEGGKKQYRIGETMDIVLKPTGGLIEPYTVSLDDSANLPATVSFDPATGKLTGPLPVSGRYSAIFTLKNGDGVTDTVSLAFSVHNRLSIEAVPAAPQIAQYEATSQLFPISYDKESVIGSATLSILGGPLPEGIRLQEGEYNVAGGTRLPPMSYGPFKIKLTDESGDFVETNDFRIDVTARKPLTGTVTEPEYQVNLPSARKPFAVVQAPLAENFLALNYELLGPKLPEGLAFNPASGVIAGTPLKKETVSGFTIKASEVSADNLQVTSTPFSVVVADPPPIGVVASASILKGNANGPFISSGPLKTRLKDIEARLVGGADSVIFSAVSPSIDLSVNSANGALEGAPKSEFDGQVSIDFVDGGSRPGTLKVPVEIYPYPALTAAPNFELPRLAQAEQYGIEVIPNTGFYDGIDWSLAPTSDALPSGLTLNRNGEIIGSTDATVGITRNLVVRARSKANGITVDQPLLLKLVERVPPTLRFPGKPFWIKINELTGKVTDRLPVAASDYLKGSYVTPVRYSLDTETAPDWMTIDPLTGAISGNFSIQAARRG